MSTSEPFLPAGEAPRDPDSHEHDTLDDDTLEESGVDDPDAAAVSAEENSTFQTPQPGESLSPEALEKELDDDA
ncbi:hypothetical protein [Labedella endophytica]|uniref:Uncharacterized protein n=1 Tax=Labedella endophytica TaxID=1523160 RepID=A0A433JUW9_9MICO|nr:hypothetical protein [Labedella endophytica]RUR01913.1 hypothetical protein ELQ94_10760 [Labedella endophytica]